jgi:hypothetical protein
MNSYLGHRLRIMEEHWCCQFDLEERFGRRDDHSVDCVHLTLVDMLLQRRQYSVLEHILRDDGFCLPLLESDVYDIVRSLAKNG